MNKVANVVFAYVPKNDDELELKVGDKIEVIGFEEEGKTPVDDSNNNNNGDDNSLVSLNHTVCN